jgi:hypothetical protein
MLTEMAELPLWAAAPRPISDLAKCISKIKSGEAPPFRIIYIWGPGGSGKSSLIARFQSWLGPEVKMGDWPTRENTEQINDGESDENEARFRGALPEERVLFAESCPDLPALRRAVGDDVGCSKVVLVTSLKPPSQEFVESFAMQRLMLTVNTTFDYAAHAAQFK